MQFFFQELYTHIDKNSEKRSEDMFLIKIAIKGTSLRLKSPLKVNIPLEFIEAL